MKGIIFLGIICLAFPIFGDENSSEEIEGDFLVPLFNHEELIVEEMTPIRKDFLPERADIKEEEEPSPSTRDVGGGGEEGIGGRRVVNTKGYDHGHHNPNIIHHGSIGSHGKYPVGGYYPVGGRPGKLQIGGQYPSRFPVSGHHGHYPGSGHGAVIFPDKYPVHGHHGHHGHHGYPVGGRPIIGGLPIHGSSVVVSQVGGYPNYPVGGRPVVVNPGGGTVVVSQGGVHPGHIGSFGHGHGVAAHVGGRPSAIHHIGGRPGGVYPSGYPGGIHSHYPGGYPTGHRGVVGNLVGHIIGNAISKGGSNEGFLHPVQNVHRPGDYDDDDDYRRRRGQLVWFV